MTLGSDGNDGTLKSPSLRNPPRPTLPIELIEEIFYMLPVKLLLQLRCLCKQWNSLISDPIFIKKHLHISTMRNLCFLTYFDCKFTLKFYPFNSVYEDTTSNETVLLEFCRYLRENSIYMVGNCNGILCIGDNYKQFVNFHLWNPTLRKLNELPTLDKPCNFTHCSTMMYGFGYDPVSDNYKVVVFFRGTDNMGDRKYQVNVHALGSDCWKIIAEFPFVVVPFKLSLSGQFVGDTVNWLVKDNRKNQYLIVSLDLKNESYQEILLHDNCVVYPSTSRLSVFKDCLCVISGNDVWVMKEFGNKESWTKLFSISWKEKLTIQSDSYIKTIYVYEDDGELVGNCKHNYIYLYCKYGASNFRVGNNLQVCSESLISPYS